MHWISGHRRGSSWNWDAASLLSLVRSFSIWLGSSLNHLGAHRHSYCYSEMVTRHTGPFRPTFKLTQLTQVSLIPAL